MRHAQPAWEVQGTSDMNPALSPHGLAQAERLMGIDWGTIDELWVSTMLRAEETARPISKATAIEIQRFSWLEELRPPDHWHGLSRNAIDDEFRAFNSRALDQWGDGNGGLSETFDDFRQRVTGGMAAMLGGRGVNPGSHPGIWDILDPEKRIMIVAHGGTNSVILSHLLGYEPVPWEWERFPMSHASLTTVRPARVGGTYTFSLRGYSETGHLAPGMVSY